jgi:hypothetical protein
LGYHALRVVLEEAISDGKFLDSDGFKLMGWALYLQGC